MGYYTTYRLKSDVLDVQKLVNDLEEITGYSWDTDLYLDCVKWYDALDNMKELSKKYPYHLFTLHGEGEENGDMWIAYFKNGKMQHERAKIAFDPYDESKLK